MGKLGTLISRFTDLYSSLGFSDHPRALKTAVASLKRLLWEILAKGAPPGHSWTEL